MRVNLDWAPFFEVRRGDMPYRKMVAAYAKIATSGSRRRASRSSARSTCRSSTSVANEWFGSDGRRDAIRLKVQALFPAHEHDQFTQHFFDEVQAWRAADLAVRAPRKKKSARPRPVVIKAAAKRTRKVRRPSPRAKSKSVKPAKVVARSRR